MPAEPPAPAADEEALATGLFCIVGTGRCGTTLLQAMLASHPRLAIPPETHFFSRFDPLRHGFGDPVPEARSEAYIEHVLGTWWWSQLGIDDAALAAAVRSGTRSARGLFLWLLRTLAGEDARPGVRLGEKTPHHERFIERIREIFPALRCIHMYRDPRDVVVSLRKEWWWTEPSIWRTALYWRRVMERQRALAARLGPDAHLELRYESLVEDPEGELRRVCAFLGEAFDPAMLAYHERARSGFLEVERAWKGLTTRPIDRARHGRYRDVLAPREIRLVERTAGPELARRGYEPDPAAGGHPFWPVLDLGDRARWRLGRLRTSIAKRLGLRRRPAARPPGSAPVGGEASVSG